MTRNDYQILFTALGFTAVAVQGDVGQDGAAKARAFAGLIESFCRAELPEAFAHEEINNNHCNKNASSSIHEEA